MCIDNIFIHAMMHKHGKAIVCYWYLLYLFSFHRVAFGTYLLSIALFVVNVRWGAIYMLITGMYNFQLYLHGLY